MYKVYLTKKAEKELNKLASEDTKRLLEMLPKLSLPNTSNLDIRKMVNAKGFNRLRVGKMRVIFEIDDEEKEVWIRKVGYRGGIYRS